MPATQIQTRQIADGAIDNSKVAAGAAIATNKLADGANFVKKDGSVAMTGNFDAGNNRIVNVTTPSSANDAATKTYVDTAVAALPSAYKYRNVRAASTGNVDTSSAPSTLDGVTLAADDRVLLKNQSTQSQNGIYVFASAGAALTRATDSDAWAEITGSLVFVDEGTTNADTAYYCTANSGGTLGSTAITYAQDGSGGLTTSNFVDKEVPSGSINGSNTAFTLANTPVSGSEHVYLNGLLMRSGAGNDYTISGTTITLATAPLSGEFICVSYRK